MPRPLHILVMPSWYPTGEEPYSGIYCRDQVQLLHQAGNRVGVVHAEARSMRFLTISGLLRTRFQRSFAVEEGIPTCRLHGWTALLHHPDAVRIWIHLYARLAERYIQEFGIPDLLHAHITLWGGVAAARIAHRYRLPLVLTEHFSGYVKGTIRPWQHPFITRTMADAQTIVAVSKAQAQAIQPWAGKTPIHVIPNVVDIRYFALPPRPRPSSPPFRFLAVANLYPTKRLDLLLRAFAHAYRGTQTELRIIGGGGEEPELRALCASLQLHQQVTFLGPQVRERVREEMWQAHALVLPSSHETFGVVLIEAMATGIPVISFDSGGPADIITPNTGILLPNNGDKAVLTERLQAALQALPERYSAYDPHKIRNYTRDQFGPMAVKQRLLDLYSEMLEHPL